MQMQVELPASRPARFSIPSATFTYKIAAAFLTAVTSTTVATAQSVPDKMLKLSAKELQPVVLHLNSAPDAKEFIDGVYDSYSKQFDRALRAKNLTTEWLNSQMLLVQNPEFIDDGYARSLTVDFRWQVGARELESAVYSTLKERFPGEAETLARVARDHLRHCIARGTTYSAQERVIDLRQRLRRIDPEAEKSPAVDAILTRHEVALHPLLVKLDKAQYTFNRYLYGHRKYLEGLNWLNLGNPFAVLDEAVQKFVERDQSHPRILEETRRALQELAGVLPAAANRELRLQSIHLLYPFIFTGQAAVPARVREALKDPDLTEQQRTALRKVGEDFEQSLIDRLPRILNSYDATLTASHRTNQFRAYAYKAMGMDFLAQAAADYEKQANEVDSAFKREIDEWYGEASHFNERIEEITGRKFIGTQFAENELPYLSDPVEPEDAEPVTTPPEIEIFFSPRFSAPALEQKLEELKFNPNSREIIRTLHDDLCKEFATARAKFEEQTQEVERKRAKFTRENPNVESWMVVGEDFGSLELRFVWFEKRRALENEFVEGVAAILGPDEAFLWKETIQALTRDRLLKRCREDWGQPSAFDLVLLLDALTLSAEERGAVASPRQTYIEELDRALVTCEERRVASSRRRLANSYNVLSGSTPEKTAGYAAASKEWQDLVEVVTKVTERGAQQITEALGDENRVKFIASFNQRRYPMLYTPTPATLVFDELNSPFCAGVLTAEQSAAVAQIETDYLSAEPDLQTRTAFLIEESRRPDSVKRVQKRREEFIANGGNWVDFDDRNSVVTLLRTRLDLVANTARGISDVVDDKNPHPPSFAAPKLGELPLSAKIFFGIFEKTTAKARLE